MGFLWALFSVGLVSAAQLLLRSAMGGLAAADRYSGLSPASAAFRAWYLRPVFRPAGLPVVNGLLVLCPPPSTVIKSVCAVEPELYLVWAAAIWLPGWHEPFYWQSLLGVAIIVAGVLTIFWPVKRR